MRFARYPAALRPEPRILLVPSRVAVVGIVLFFSLGASVGCRKSAPKAPPMAVVSGRVLGSDGRPLAGVPVTLNVEPDDGRVPIASVRTDAQGWFHADKIPAGRFEVHARAEGHVEAIRPIQVGAAGSGAVELRLAAAVALRGRIEDSRHAAIPMARVVAFAVSDAGRPRLHETRSDERGAFAITDLAAGPHRLLIEAPGLGTASAGPLQAPDPDVVVVLPGEIRALVGRVTRDGQPVRGAKVRLGGESVLEPRGAETDEEGHFAFTGLGPGSYVLRAELGALISAVVTEEVRDAQPGRAGPTRLVQLPLGPGRFAGGVVTDENGRPVGGATIQVDLVPPTGLWSSVPTDAAGRWATPPLAPGTYRIRARRPGFVARRTATVELGPVGAGPVTTTGVKLELVRTGRISGVVVNDKHAPLAGATVYDRAADAEELGVIWSRLPMAAEAAALPSGSVLPAAAATDAAGSRRVTSDGAGRFLLRDVPPGRIRVEVLSPGSVPLRTPPVTLKPGGDVDVGTLRIQGAIPVSGTVVDPDGSPVSGVRVTAAGVGATTATGPSGLYALTGGDGAFTLPLGTGEHRLTASGRGRADASTNVHVAAGIPPPVVTLRFAKGGDLALNGVVRDTAGRPLVRARVLAHAVESDGDGDRSPSSAVPATGPSATTDAGGAFRLTGLAPGPVRLEVVSDRYGTYRTTLIVDADSGSGAAAVVAVPVPGAIEGEVHERITGAPVPGFQIEADGPDGARAKFPEIVAKKRGGDPLRFALRKLAPGHWTLRVRAPGFQTLTHQLEVPSASTPGETSVRGLRLELGR